jgi:Zn-dependent peptidase ImmA (M78 family)/DNA-binding XRE family transcriptional regulator
LDADIVLAVAEIPVNGVVLAWARKVRLLSEQEAAQLLGISRSELQDYESGVRRPTLTLLQRMSDKYQINYASLFMPEPLELETLPLKDYRTRREHESKNLSIDTIVAIQEVTDTLETFADLKADQPKLFAAPPLDAVGKGEHAPELAIRQRKKFGVSVTEQQDWRSAAVARDRWRQAVERRGVFVYFIPMGPECSGVTINHEGLFAVCVNDSETNNGARIFTLFHEYAHVLRRQTGISDENPSNPTERFCNEFAADFLLPYTAIENIFGEPTKPRDFTAAEVGKYAKKFHVSLSALAIRLEKGGWAKRGLYEMIARFIPKPPEPPPAHKKIKIDPIRTQARRLGARHTTITLEALRRGAINTADAHELLGLAPSQFAALKAVFE